MNAKSLRKIIQALPEHGTYSRRLGHHLKSIKSDSFSPTGKNQNQQNQSQKEHWLSWLSEYNGPGHYIRSIHSGIPARKIYNRAQNSAMVLYLPEALGVSKKLIKEAYENALKTDAVSMSKQCGAIRKTIPWETVQAAIDSLK